MGVRAAVLHCLAGALAGLRGRCSLPRDLAQRVARKELALVGQTGGYQLLEAEDGAERSLLVLDCATQRQLLFLHIPKNAGSTVEDAGSAGGVQWGWHMRDAAGPLRLPASQTMPDGNVCTGWHVPPGELQGNNPYADADVFCVTRDPWERMRSEYVYLLSSKWGTGMPFLRDGPECTKEGFNLFVARSLDAMSAGKRWLDDCHLLPQWEFIEGPDGREWCPTRLPLGNLTASFNELMVERGLQLQLQPQDKSRSAADHCPQISAMPPAELFDAATRTKMRAAYWRDFAHLGDALA